MVEPSGRKRTRRNTEKSRLIALAIAALATVSACSDSTPGTYQGYVEGEFVHVGSGVAGRLERLAVQRGEAVAIDAALFDLESMQETAAVAQADEALAAAEAQLADMGTGRRGAEVDVVRAQLAQATVVTAAIEEASLREQIAATEAAIAIAGRQIELVERLERLGAVPKLDVVLQGGELARARAMLPALQERLAQTRHRLAVYLGQPPGEAHLPELTFADLRLPTELPLSLPSDLARQRPDIRAAEALLHEASARVGVAAASFYPQFTISAMAGGVAIDPLINGTAGFSLLAASLAQPLFRGGQLRSQKRMAEAAFDQAGAAYREVVLSGLQDVADILVSLDADARTLRERAEAAKLAKTAYDITSKQYEAGGVSLFSLLDSQRQYLATSVEEARAVGERFVDSAALFQALGGGWWNAEQPAAAP